ncbi:phasin family protein [Diaphorobacter sp. HDW4A]|uniref:phasin family protein n=1 Tax=Diaphorobacter sp. HDW4A TaxID=2714924 RepID=UPI00140B784F|nr:phasin family protein [Diaphorobacter sp. HDW4A]QIL81875.1 phasin family protein [Diaphorobacter sp. HDW4A]
MSSKSSSGDKGGRAIPEQLQQLQQLPHLAKESAEQIWLAGLGAFSKAQQEGGKVFNVLVQDGLALQKQAQAMAQEQLQAASSRFEGLTSKMSERAAEPLDKLESLFEHRVAKALLRMGIPSAQDLEALHAQIEALSRELEETRAQLRSVHGAEQGDAAPARKSTRKSGS